MLVLRSFSSVFPLWLFQPTETAPYLRNGSMKRSPNGRSAELLHKFVTVFDTEAESVAFSNPAEMRSARATGAAPAAPAGGAQSDWGRGCGNFGFHLAHPVVDRVLRSMSACAVGRSVVALGVCAIGAMSGSVFAAQGQSSPSIAVPSGQQVTLSEVLLDDAPGELWARFRFVAPDVTPETQASSSGDIDHLCGALAQPYLAQYDIHPARVVISMSSRELPFGSTDPDVTQFFETYRLEGETCVWEGF